MTIYAILSSVPHNPHYLTRYIKFIEYCQHTNLDVSYFEKHHICPKGKDMFPEYKSLSTYKWNRVDLTARQHFIAHWMLWKAFPSSSSQFHAFFALCNGQRNTDKHGDSYNKINSKTYEILKTAKSNSMKGENNYFSKNIFKGEDNHFYGKTHTNEFKRKQSERRKNKTWSEIFGDDVAIEMKNTKSKFMTENNPFKGKQHSEETKSILREKALNRSEETKQKIRESLKNIPKKTCPHCGKVLDCRNYARYHGDKCKYKN